MSRRKPPVIATVTSPGGTVRELRFSRRAHVNWLMSRLPGVSLIVIRATGPGNAGVLRMLLNDDTSVEIPYALWQGAVGDVRTWTGRGLLGDTPVDINGAVVDARGGGINRIFDEQWLNSVLRAWFEDPPAAVEWRATPSGEEVDYLAWWQDGRRLGARLFIELDAVREWWATAWPRGQAPRAVFRKEDDDREWVLRRDRYGLLEIGEQWPRSM